jgi:hypothetical protein
MEENQYSFRARAQYMEAERIAQHAEWYLQQIPALEANGMDWVAERYQRRVQVLLEEAKMKETTAHQMKDLADQSYEQALKEKMLHEGKQMKELEEGLRSTLLEEEVVQPTEPWYNHATKCIDPSQVLDEPGNLIGQETIKIEDQDSLQVKEEQPEITMHLTSQPQNELLAPSPQWNMTTYQNAITMWTMEETSISSEVPSVPPSTPTGSPRSESDASIVDLQDIFKGNVQ